MGEKFNFNIGWKFIKEDVPNAYQLDFDDTEWQLVSLPHTYNDTDTFDNYMEGGHNGERSMFTGKTWYRKVFHLEESDKGKTFLIEFEGVRQAADVFVNGKKLKGKNENGFIPFGYDLTPYVHVGEEPNTIAVKEICFRCGFENESHFSRYFKTNTGLSPREFRKTNVMNRRKQQ